MNLFGFELPTLKERSRVLQTFVTFTCLAASQTMFTEMLSRLFPFSPPLCDRGRETMKGGALGELIRLGLFWGWLPIFADFSLAKKKVRKEVKIN